MLKGRAMRRLALGLVTVALAVAAVPTDVAAATVETPGVIGPGDGVRQLIQEFVDTSGGDVTTEEIVTFLNGLDERPSGSATIAYGSEYVFNPATTSHISAAALSDTKFVVAYRDWGNSNYGTAVIGTVSGAAITYGSEHVFNTAGTYDISVAALSSSKFVVAYSDVGNLGRGTARIGAVSGSTITYGSEHVFNSGSTSYISAAALSDTKFVVAYRDDGNSAYGTARIGDYTPDPTPTPSPSPTPTLTATTTATPTPTPTATATVQVWIDFPDAPGVNVTLEVYPDHDFVVRTNISYVYRLMSANYDITYNAAVVEVVLVSGWVPKVRKGDIGGEDFPVNAYSFVPEKTQGRLRVIQYLDAYDWRTGDGYMSSIFFHVVGSPGQSSPIEIGKVSLGDYKTHPIPRTEFNSSVLIIAPTPSPTPTPTASATPTCQPGDADFDGEINAGDITKVERIILTWDEETPGADANGDGKVNATDIGVIEYMILEIYPWNHVHIEAPASLPNGADFTADVFVTYVEAFSSAGLVVTYNSSVLDLMGVSGGSLLEIDPGVSADFYTVDTSGSYLVAPGAVRINGSIAGGGGVDAAGYLAQMQFHVNGSAGQSSPIAFNVSQSWLRDSIGGAINATWADDWFTVAP